MPTRSVRVARGEAAEQRLVFGCVPDPRARGRLQTALRGHATLRWFASFAEIRRALEHGERSATAIIGLSDRCGGTAAGFARDVREDMTGTSVVVCCDLGGESQAPIAALAESGVHDILFTGVNDEGHGARTVIFGAVISSAADVVMRAVGSSIPDVLTRFVDLVVRRPRELQRVSEVAAALHIPRQTLGRWCRVQRYVRPEELLVWARIFLVVTLLETTSRTLESIAAELCYGSPTALRNRIREYTGMTATQVRGGGLDLVLAVFARRVEEVRAEAGRSAEHRGATKAG
jgi:AraC-like DNA-binding protein/rhodanese-related sulfurtransferase